MVVKTSPTSPIDSLSQQVESEKTNVFLLYLKKKKKKRSSSCSEPLWPFRRGVFGLELQENETGTSCRNQFTLDGSIFTREESMNKEQFSPGVLPQLSFHAQREWKERGKKKTLWEEWQHSRGMFDIHLDSEGRVKSQTCASVFVIKQVRVFHLKGNRGGRADLPVQSFCFIQFFIRKNHKQQFLPVPFSHRVCLRPLITSFCLETVIFFLFAFFWKTHEFIGGNRRGTGGKLVASLCGIAVSWFPASV